jgi:hypothetical protein
MKGKEIIAALMIATTIMVASCDNSSVENKKAEDKPSETVAPQGENEINKDSIISEIDKKRSHIESLDVSPLEISTANLREKTKQKWSKIHFYQEGDGLVKIKTYPHTGISKRTEEFYVDKSKLILVVIEDDGTGPKGKSKSDLDKMYYFDNEKLIHELKSGGEAEYTIKNSDAEELLAEFYEYQEIFKKEKK